MKIEKLIYTTNTRIPSEKANSYQSMQMCYSFAKIFKNVEMWVPKAHNTEELTKVKDVYKFYNIEKNFRIKFFFQLDSKLLAKFNQFIWANTKGVVFALNVIVNLFKYRKKSEVAIYTRDWYLLFFFLGLRKVGIFENKIFYESHKFSKFLLIVLKKIDGLIVINNYLLKLYQNEGITNALVSHDGVNTDEYKNITTYKFDKEKNVFKIVYTGSLFKWKGVYSLVDAIPDIKQKVEVIFVGGSGEYLKDFKIYLKKKRLKNVTVVPHVPKKETLKYIEDADVLILPNSAKDKMSLYTSPIKLFEYMASLRPIVAANLSSICEILNNNENAILFEPDNSKDLANKINFVLEQDCNDIVNEACENVQKYSWDNRAKNIKVFIETTKKRNT